MVASLEEAVPPGALPEWPQLPEEIARQWLLPPVWERMIAGRGEFLADLRPAVPVFVRFGGLDFESDPKAPSILDDFVTHAERKLSPFPPEKNMSKHYLRFTMKDRPGVLARLAGILGSHKVSIASVYQDDPGSGWNSRGVPIVIETHRVLEGAVKAALKEADALSVSVRRAVHLRIEDFQ